LTGTPAWQLPGNWMDMDYFLCVIGMVMVVEGVPYFAAPEQMQRWMAKIMEMAPASLRRFGLAMMVAGLLLVYVGRR
jgi:uncharacterized protein YjeT (DUF2065 family)